MNAQTKYYYRGKQYLSLDAAKRKLLSDVRENRQTEVLMGRCSTWEPPNWGITDKPDFGFGEFIVSASDVWMEVLGA